MAHGEFAADYADALQRYVRCPDEDGLYAGYRLGRRALEGQIGLLDLLTIHPHASPRPSPGRWCRSARVTTFPYPKASPSPLDSSARPLHRLRWCTGGPTRL